MKTENVKTEEQPPFSAAERNESNGHISTEVPFTTDEQPGSLCLSLHFSEIAIPPKLCIEFSTIETKAFKSPFDFCPIQTKELKLHFDPPPPPAHLNSANFFCTRLPVELTDLLWTTATTAQCKQQLLSYPPVTWKGSTEMQLKVYG